MIEFTLTYRGELKPNGDTTHKHALRRAFHVQLRHLWGNPAKMPPTALARPRPDIEKDASFHLRIGGFSFVPIISESGLNVAELDVTVVQPEAAGTVITKTGDVDNRLKTLFDAMKVPGQAGELPPNAAPTEHETPFFCVVQDDHLISRVSVEARRLLDPDAKRTEVLLIINVRGRHVSEYGLWLARQPGTKHKG